MQHPDCVVVVNPWERRHNSFEFGRVALEQFQLFTSILQNSRGNVGQHSFGQCEHIFKSSKSHFRLDSRESARRAYDFAVRYGDLLFDRESVDVTRSYLRGENLDVRVEAPVPVSTDCEPGALWARVIRTTKGLLISLIDLSGQEDDVWDAPKAPAAPLAGVRVAVERARRDAPRFDFADPDETPGLVRLEPTLDGRHDTVELPPFGPWSIVLVREDGA